MKITEFATDETKETGGVWIDYAAGLRLKIASTDNREYTRFMLENTGVLSQRGSRLRSLTAIEKVERVACEGVAKYILLDWEGLEDGEGNAVEYSFAKALEYLRGYKRFRMDVLEIAQDEANFKAEQVEGEAKNLPNASDGS